MKTQFSVWFRCTLVLQINLGATTSRLIGRRSTLGVAGSGLVENYSAIGLNPTGSANISTYVTRPCLEMNCQNAHCNSQGSLLISPSSTVQATISPNASPSSTTISPRTLPGPESAEMSNPTVLTKYIARIVKHSSIRDASSVIRALRHGVLPAKLILK